MKTSASLRRNGATAVETAIVISVLFFIVIGLIVGGMGVFRYQQVSCLSKEAARWASVRGGDYHKDTGLDSPTKQQIVEQAILTHSAGMDPAAISVNVEWIDCGSNTATDWDAATKDVHSLNANGEYVSNSVRVTVTYSWSTGLFGSPSTYQSVCEMPMSY
jgi:Flp pilus assembly protein TadG